MASFKTNRSGEFLSVSQHGAEVAKGARFEFGKNWTSFLGSLNEDRGVGATQSLQDIEVSSLEDRAF